MKKHYNKLIRDRIPEIIEETGKNYQARRLSPEELPDYLYAKLREEVEEFIENPCAEEAADILEILNFICEHKDIRPAAVKAEKLAKRSRRGGFQEGLLLEWVEYP